ncbi:outer membrane protein assembly factor BamB family protein [Yinghuangia sp. YIM S09857]|uniref:outer membrane protein assembly factor BamB family protein n=1 Tax=Yinghuangia sp. YIM S09857 TaxID=3436929 RepID=UPI003F52B496
MRGILRLGGIAAAIGLMVSTAACSGDGSLPDPTPTTAASGPTKPADALPEAWSAPTPDRIASVGTITSDPGVVLAALTDQTVVAYTADSGKEAWRLQLPVGAKRCGFPDADAATAAGLAVVVFSPVEGTACTSAGVVDTRTGALLWHQDFRDQMAYARNVRASLGPTVLTVELPCGDLRRFDATSQKVLPTFLTPDRACAHSVAHNGRYVAVINSPDDGSPEIAPGWIAPGGKRMAEFALYDAETGGKLWGRPVEDRDGLEVFDVVSSEPLALDMEIELKRTIRMFDAQGNEVRLPGDEHRLSRDTASVGQNAGGVWLENFAPRAPLNYNVRAVDLKTGDEVYEWQLDPSKGPDHIVGVSDGRIVTSQIKPFKMTYDKPSYAEARIVAYDTRTGTRTELGQVDLTRRPEKPGESYLNHQILAVDDNYVYLTRYTDTSTEFVALRLPG